MDTLHTPTALDTLQLGSEEREERLKPYIITHLWDEPAIYCGTYRKYNNGSLDGAWLDLRLFDSYEEFIEICRLLHDDEPDPELMFQDFQGFPRAWYDESCMEDTFDNIMDYCQLSEDDREIFDAYMECFGEADFAHYQSNYMGKFESEEDFAEMIVAECYDLERMMGNLAYYFDYKRFARDLFMTDYTISDEGYVFSN